MFDQIEVTSVGNGEKIRVELFSNTTGVSEMGTSYGVLRIEGVLHVLIMDLTDSDNPRFALRCPEEFVGIQLPMQVIEEDLDVWCPDRNKGSSEVSDLPDSSDD